MAVLLKYYQGIYRGQNILQLCYIVKTMSLASATIEIFELAGVELTHIGGEWTGDSNPGCAYRVNLDACSIILICLLDTLSLFVIFRSPSVSNYNQALFSRMCHPKTSCHFR